MAYVGPPLTLQILVIEKGHQLLLSEQPTESMYVHANFRFRHLLLQV